MHRLPYDTLIIICKYLLPFDLYMLRLACRHLWFSLTNKCFHVREAVVNIERLAFAWSLQSFPRENYTYHLELAARAGNLPVVEWFACRNLHASQVVLEAAAKFAHVNIIRWLRGRYCLFLNSNVAQLAATSGDIETMFLLRTYGLRWDLITTITAAQRLDKKMLNWLIEHECPWDLTVCVRNGIQNCNIAMLEWLFDQGYCTVANYPYNAGIAAIWTGCLPVLQWLTSKGCIQDFDGCVVLAIMRSDMLQVQWLLRTVCVWRPHYLELATRFAPQDSKMVAWMVQNF